MEPMHRVSVRALEQQASEPLDEPFPAVRRRGCCPDEGQASGPVLEPMHQVSVRALEQQASVPLDEPFPAVRRRGCYPDEDPKKI